MEILEIKKDIIEDINLKKNFTETYNKIQLNLISGKINEDGFYSLMNLFFIKSHVYQEKTEELLKFYIKGRFNLIEVTYDEIINNINNVCSEVEFMLMIFLLIKPKILCDNNEELINHYKQVNLNLDKLIKSFTQSVKFIFETPDQFKKILLLNYPYYHVYNGLNNKELYLKITKLWRILCPNLTYCKENFVKNISNKIKIGFASSFLQLNQSVCRDRIGIIRSLIQDPNFDVYLFTTSKSEEAIYNVAINSIGFKNKVILDESIETARTIISQHNLDVLVYPEIGMDLFFYLLAFSRLAPIQINTWGHSETSGIDTIDYYFSSKYYEVEDSDKFYSEKLIKLDSLCTYYYSLRIFDFYPQINKLSQEEARIHNNLPKLGVIYGMFQTVFKYHPDTISIIKYILYNDPKAIILLLTYSELEERFIDYLDRNLGYHSNRVRILSRGSLKDYTKLIKCVDIILDSYPFGGCNSSLEVFALGKVIVTLPSDKINGRFTYGFYQKMGILEPVCKDINDFVSKSIYYANNKTELKKLENKIAENANKLFEEEASILTWKNKLIELTFNNKIKCEIYDENKNKIKNHLIERTEQEMAYNYIESDDLVLELGARYGSVSCVINLQLSNRKNQVVVEPDQRVWNALEMNKKINNCEFDIIKGFISKNKMTLTNLDVCLNGYGSTSIINNNSNIDSFDLYEIMETKNLKFNVLVADCEGFLESFFDQYPDFYKQLRMIIFEEDYPDRCNYDKIKKNLLLHNFIEIEKKGQQNVWIKMV